MLRVLYSEYIINTIYKPGPALSAYIYIYMDGTPPPPLTYPFASFETQGWVGAGGSVMERRPENAQD